MKSWALIVFLVLAGTAYWFWPSDEGETGASSQGPELKIDSPVGSDSGEVPGEGAGSQLLKTPSSNSVLDQAQASLDAGNEKEAIAILERGLSAEQDPKRRGPLYFEIAKLGGGTVDEEKLRLYFSKALESDQLTPEDAKLCADELGRLNDRIIFSRHDYSKSMSYEIVPGDSLSKICSKLKKQGIQIEVGMIQRVNRMGEKTTIFPGDSLKVPTEPLRILVEKRKFRIRVFLGDVILREYRVGLGTNDCTPESEFTIQTKIKEPPWFNKREGKIHYFGEKEHVLGTRWLGFDNTENAEGYGIHGTIDPSSIGKEMSNGCVRMLNSDVESLFEIIPRGTPVLITL